MTEIERYKKLSGEEAALRARLATLPKEIEERKQALTADRAAAVRSDVLDAPDAETKRESVAVRQAEISRLEADLADAGERARIMHEVRDEVRSRAAVEIRDEQEHQVAAAVHEFCEALRAAHGAEVAAIAAIEKARLRFLEIDAPSPLPRWQTLLARDSSNPGYMKPEFDDFLNRARSQGWDKK